MNKKLIQIKKKIVPLLKKYGVVKAGIFGSYARGDQKKRSDIDMLVKGRLSLLDLVKLERELKEKLCKDVDLLAYKGIHPRLKDRILKEEVKIYEKRD